MTRAEWIIHHGFCEEDMRVIDECLTFGGKIIAINDKPLGYEDIKIST